MLNRKFEAYKIQRELNYSGKEYAFYRKSTNTFGEPVETDPTLVCTVQGLYHEQNGSIRITTGDTTQVRNEKIPMILCLYTSATDIKRGDFVTINAKRFEVTGVVNVQEWGIVSDISLEVVDDGNTD